MANYKSRAPTLTIKTFSETADWTTTSTTFVDTDLTVTLSNIPGKAIITATFTSQNDTANNILYCDIADDGTEVGKAIAVGDPTVNFQTTGTCKHHMLLDGSTVTLGVATLANTAKIQYTAGKQIATLHVLEIS